MRIFNKDLMSGNFKIRICEIVAIVLRKHNTTVPHNQMRAEQRANRNRSESEPES